VRDVFLYIFRVRKILHYHLNTYKSKSKWFCRQQFTSGTYVKRVCTIREQSILYRYVYTYIHGYTYMECRCLSLSRVYAQNIIKYYRHIAAPRHIQCTLTVVYYYFRFYNIIYYHQSSNVRADKHSRVLWHPSQWRTQG